MNTFKEMLFRLGIILNACALTGLLMSLKHEDINTVPFLIMGFSAMLIMWSGIAENDNKDKDKPNEQS